MTSQTNYQQNKTAYKARASERQNELKADQKSFARFLTESQLSAHDRTKAALIRLHERLVPSSDFIDFHDAVVGFEAIQRGNDLVREILSSTPTRREFLLFISGLSAFQQPRVKAEITTRLKMLDAKEQGRQLKVKDMVMED